MNNSIFGGNIFGDNSNNNNIFGNNNNNNNIFGTPTNNNNNNNSIFGNNNNNSIFGNTSPSQNNNIFGNNNTNNTNSNNIFGNTNIFGNNTSNTSNIFGSPQNNNNNSFFNTNTTSNNNTFDSSNLFGTNNNNSFFNTNTNNNNNNFMSNQVNSKQEKLNNFENYMNLIIKKKDECEKLKNEQTQRIQQIKTKIKELEKEFKENKTKFLSEIETNEKNEQSLSPNSIIDYNNATQNKIGLLRAIKLNYALLFARFLKVMIMLSNTNKGDDQLFKNEMIKIQRELESPTNIYAKSKEIKWRIIMQDNKSKNQGNLENEQEKYVDQISEIFEINKTEINNLTDLLQKLNHETDILKSHLSKSYQSSYY